MQMGQWWGNKVASGTKGVLESEKENEKWLKLTEN